MEEVIDKYEDEAESREKARVAKRLQEALQERMKATEAAKKAKEANRPLGAVSSWLQKKFQVNKKQLENKAEPPEEEVTGSELGSIDQMADGLGLNESGETVSDEGEIESAGGFYN